MDNLLDIIHLFFQIYTGFLIYLSYAKTMAILQFNSRIFVGE